MALGQLVHRSALGVSKPYLASHREWAASRPPLERNTPAQWGLESGATAISVCQTEENLLDRSCGCVPLFC